MCKIFVFIPPIFYFRQLSRRKGLGTDLQLPTRAATRRLKNLTQFSHKMGETNMCSVVGLSRKSDNFELLFGKDEKRGKCWQCTVSFASRFIRVQLKQTTNLDN